jgi:hypothetical protein
MKIIYLGAEVPSNRTLLETTTATSIGVSFWRLTKRGLPKRKNYLLSDHFKSDNSIYVHGGIPKDANLDQDELESFAAEYEEFIANNMDRITLFTELDHPLLTQEFIETQRKTCWAEVPPGKFLPVWHSPTGQAGLNKLVDSYLDVGISGQDIEAHSFLAAATRTFVRRRGTRFHAIACAKPDNLRSIQCETASTMSWLSPMMHGETIIWDGSRIVRYPKRMKDQARSRYRHIYDKAGIDFDKIIEDDPKEVCKLAVWSYERLEDRINTVGPYDEEEFISDISSENVPATTAETTLDNADTKGVQERKLIPRNPDEIVNLPVFAYDTKTEVDADGVIKEVQVIQSQAGTLRQCNTCFVAANCPAFKPNNACAFKLPVEVKTKEQLKSLINAIIEMQGQRVAFMRFSEEMNGGYADPNVSQEIDRLFKLIKTVKELDDSREFIRMTVERQGSAGVLSQIFGDKANVLRELPNNGLNEEETTQIIKGAIEENQ